MMKVKQYLTPLIIMGWIAIIGALINLFINWAELSYAEGWGVVGMIGIILYGSIALTLGLLVRLITKNLKLRILIELILIALAASYIVFYSGRF
tara:strand:- start:63146 stop:63427 length:282 start_codon:yes stop_codon:yes gene_type:complete